MPIDPTRARRLIVAAAVVGLVLLWVKAARESLRRSR